jgi:hypothetical protein
VFNIAGGTRLTKEGLKVGRWVYFGTDPVYHELACAKGDIDICSLIEEHDDFVTYGENIGNLDCLIPPLPSLLSKTRQPVLLDLWKAGQPSREEFTTVSNWQQIGLDVEYQGKTYYWSKHHEFLKFIDLPRWIDQPIELAMNLADRKPIRWHDNEAVPAMGLSSDAHYLLKSNGWQLADAPHSPPILGPIGITYEPRGANSRLPGISTCVYAAAGSASEVPAIWPRVVRSLPRIRDSALFFPQGKACSPLTRWKKSWRLLTLSMPTMKGTVSRPGPSRKNTSGQRLSWQECSMI